MKAKSNSLSSGIPRQIFFHTSFCKRAHRRDRQLPGWNAKLGNFDSGTFKGLIVADSINKVTGNVQNIGGIIAAGSTATLQVDDLTGTPNVKFSSCELNKLYSELPVATVKGTYHEH